MRSSLQQYKAIARLGQGGMCDVVLAVKDARGLDFTKLVVIKSLREQFAQDIDFVTMFLDEARIAARLNHPNVIQTLEVGEDGNAFFLAMEYLDGQPLNRIAQRGTSLPLAMRLAILADTLGGLHYAHELNDYDGTALRIVHRDVTPHNVFVTYDGQTKVVDFGIAKAAGRATETRGGVVKGKINYMAPEQILATRSLDRRADLFSVGVMLYEACAGARMWAGVESAEVIRALVAGRHPASPRKRNAQVHEDLDRICQKALAANPDHRYPTAAAFQEDLDAYIAAHEQRPAPRQIGAKLGEIFAEQRENARVIIESQLAGILKERRSLVEITFGGRDSDPAIEIDTSSLTGSAPSSKADGSQFPTRVLDPTLPEALPSRPRLLVGIVAVSIALLGIGAWRVVTTLGASRPPAAVGGEADTVTLTLRASPMETTFQVDDGPTFENPYIARVARDRKAHLVHARAPGFEEKTESVSFDHDASIRFSLVQLGGRQP